MDEDLITGGGKVVHVAGHLAGKETVALATMGATTGTLSTAAFDGTMASINSGTAAGAANAAGGIFAAFNSVFGLVGISVATAAGAVVNQMTYQSRRAYMRNTYKHEVGAVLGKSPEKVTDKDVDLVAKGDPQRGIEANKTIAAGIDKLKKSRNVGILVSVLSILATVTLVVAMFSLGPVAGAATAISTAIGFPTAGLFITKGLAGYGIHQALEKPISWASKKLFDMEKTTTYERIAVLERDHRNGKSLGREQVLGAFVGANHELSNFVQEHYGKEYDKLNVKDKKDVADIFEQYIPITKITESLNSGRVHVSELAFSVEGKSSGVVAGSVPDSLSMVGKARGKIQEVGERISQKLQGHPEKIAAAAPAPTPISVAPKRAIVEYDNPTPKRSFVERYKAEQNAGIQHTIH